MMRSDFLSVLRYQKEGKIRDTAEAVVVSDMSYQDDIGQLKSTRKLATWSKEIPYDEEKACIAAFGHAEESCERAKGVFLAMGIPVKSVPLPEDEE